VADWRDIESEPTRCSCRSRAAATGGDGDGGDGDGDDSRLRSVYAFAGGGGVPALVFSGCADAAGGVAESDEARGGHVSRFSTRVLATIALIVALLAAANAAAAAPSPRSASSAIPAGTRGAIAASSKAKHKGKAKHKKPAKPAGPSLSLLGFGVDRLFVANGKTITSNAQCSEMVAGDGYTIGPPQEVIDDVLARATGIPASAPVKVQDSLPEGLEELDESTLSPYGTWSVAFGNKLEFATPPGSQKNIFSTVLASHFSEAGEYEGPSAEEFDGTYAFTAVVEVDGRTLSATAKATVDCPQR
jgi:hypothetical protein